MSGGAKLVHGVVEFLEFIGREVPKGLEAAHRHVGEVLERDGKAWHEVDAGLKDEAHGLSHDHDPHHVPKGDTAAGTAAAAADARSAADMMRAKGLDAHDWEGIEGPANAARDFQSSPLYPGQDAWKDRLAEVEEEFYAGEPGSRRFVVPVGEMDKVPHVNVDYYEGVQVGADPTRGYRQGGLSRWKVVKPFPMADSHALANPQFGDGGLAQGFLGHDLSWLEEHGYIAPSGHLPLDNVPGRIPPTGRPTGAP